MQLLFGGDCHQRYAHIDLHYCLHILQCERGEPSGQSIYCDSIVCGHHIYKTVWTLQKSRDGQPHPVRAIADDVTFSLNTRSVECSLLLYHMAVAIPNPSHHVFALAGVIAMPLGYSAAILLHSLPSAASIRGRPLNGVWRIFEQILQYLNRIIRD